MCACYRRPVARSPQFDVFLSHPHTVSDHVHRLADGLRRHDLTPWLDVEQMAAGADVDHAISNGMADSHCCAVFVADDTPEGWVRAELSAAVSRSHSVDDFRVFLVLLPGVRKGFDHSHFPSLVTTRVWVDLRWMDDEVAEVELLAAAVRGQPPRRVSADSAPSPDVVCPYVGYRPFDEADTRFFWGRDADVQKMEEALATEPFLAVVGNSGSGKSSAVRACLVPALRTGGLAGDFDDVVVLTPGARPLRQLVAALAERHPQRSVASIHEDLLNSPDTLGVLTNDRVCWVVDQFEEVFTRAAEDEQTAAFVANVLRASRPGGGAAVVIVVRSDFVGYSTQHPGLSERTAAHQYIVKELAGDALTDAIVRPAAAMGVEFERGLVERILSDGAADPGMLPLVQHTLRELWNASDGVLSHAAYDRIGGVRGALARQTEAILRDLTPAQSTVARELLVRMVVLGEGERDTKRPLALAEARKVGAPEDVDAVIDRLATKRLMTAGDDEIELTHDSLLHEWPQLRSWIDERRDDIRTREALGREARRWMDARDDGTEDDSYLLSGHRLAAATAWAGRQPAVPTHVLDFLAASATAATLRSRAAVTRRRIVTAVAMATIVALAAISAFALFQWQQSSERRRAAESLALLAESAAVVRTDPALAVALVLEAETIEEADAARSAEAFREAWAAFTSREYQPRPAFAADDNWVWAVAWSPDGERVASAGSDGRLKLWDLATNEAVFDVQDHTGSVSGVAWSPDGERVVTAREDGRLQVWDLASGAVDMVLEGHGDWVRDVAWSPGGDRIASASSDGTVRVWDAASGGTVAVLEGHSGWVRDVAWSPDGDLLATAGTDETVRVWEAAGGEALQILRGHVDWVRGVAWSPNGDRLVSGGQDASVRLWDLATEESMVLEGHSQAVWSVAWSRSGDQVASASEDGAVRVWDAESGSATLRLAGHTNGVRDLAWSPDGERIVSGGEDGAVRVWDVVSPAATRVLHGHDGRALRVGWSPSGDRIVSASSDRTLIIWDSTSGVPVASLVGHEDWARDVAWSPDGRRVVSAGSDGTVRIWDAASGTEEATLSDDRFELRTVAWSPSGERLASAGEDQDVHIWDVASGSSRPLVGHTGRVHDLAWAPGGDRVASASADGTVRVWDLASSDATLTFAEHNGDVHGVAWSPSGEQLVSVGDDEVVRVWDAASGEVAIALAGHSGSVLGVAWSPDGDRLASVGEDRTLRVWDLDVGVSAIVFEGHVGSVSGVAWSPDGTRVVSSSFDQTLRISPAPDRNGACDLIRPYVRRSGVADRVPDGRTPVACDGFRPVGASG